jgi:predicted MFS family arabinose efflux permease
VFGWIAKLLGFNASFWGLTIVAVAGGILYQTRMPETKQDESAQGQAQAG